MNMADRIEVDLDDLTVAELPAYTSAWHCRVLGIDPGATALGFAWHDPVPDTWPPDDREFNPIWQVATVIPKNMTGGRRLAYIRDAYLDVLDTLKPKVILMEGYGFQSKQIARQAEVRGVLLIEAEDRGIMVDDQTAPNTLKKAITGAGHAKKDRVISAVCRALERSGSDLMVADDHQADAMVLLWMGLEAGAFSETPIPSTAGPAIAQVRRRLEAMGYQA